MPISPTPATLLLLGVLGFTFGAGPARASCMALEMRVVRLVENCGMSRCVVVLCLHYLVMFM